MNIEKNNCTEISWSLMHPVPLDVEYMKKVVAKAAAYRVDSFEICGECHSPYGGLDGLITYTDYPSVAAGIDGERIAQNRRRLREIISLAHESGRPVYYWHREIMIPSGLTDIFPDLLDAKGEFDLLGETFAWLIRMKITEAFREVPELDGVVLTLTEADYSVIHNSSPDVYPPGKVVAHIIRTFCEALEAAGKRFILRSFGSIAKDYEDILNGAADVSGAHAFEIETKITPYDFSPFLPPNPFLKKIPGLSLGAECDCLGEYLGAGYLPAANVEHIVSYVREAQSKGVDRFALRLDRIANMIFDSAYEVNLFAYHRAIDDPEADADSIWREWALRNWPACPDEMAAITSQGIEVVKKVNFIRGNVMFHMFPLQASLKWIKAGGIFALFKENISLEWQSGSWSMLSYDSSPENRRLILKEKDEAVEIITEQLEKIEKLKARLSTDQYRQVHKEWVAALEVARLYRIFCRCVCAYFDDMEHRCNQAPSLNEAIREASPFFRRYLTDDEMRFDQNASGRADALEYHAMQSRTDPLKNVYALPMWGVLNELVREYDCEYKSRQAWEGRAGVLDIIFFGALTDEWRIRRYMHASHSVLHDGRPSRIVGNRIFPNGYLEFSFNAPVDSNLLLVLEVDPDSAPSLLITVDGCSHLAGTGNGTVHLQIESGRKGSLLIRLEKHGVFYPRVYSMALIRRS